MNFAYLFAIVGAGLVTGLLFAFSNFVMRALSDIPDSNGILAMQRINERIINPLFFILFFGTPLICLFIIAAFVFQLAPNCSWLTCIGAVAYLFGPFGITMMFNVPLNNQLASADPDNSSTLWADYQTKWQRWNHVRTLMGVTSMFLLAAGQLS